MSESTGYEGHRPRRPVPDIKKGQVVRFPDPQTGRILTGTVKIPTWGHTAAVLVQLESGAYAWAWVHELSEKENNDED